VHESKATTAAIRLVARTAALQVPCVAVLDLGLGVLVGSVMWWSGWTHPPIKDFFAALAGLGGTLLIAFSVTVTQVLPVFVRNAVRNDAVNIGMHGFAQIFGAVLGVALAAIVGLGACLVLIHDPRPAHWWLMSLFGVSVVTMSVLALAIGMGTMLYVVLFFDESGESE
jgi:hypothetical protein